MRCKTSSILISFIVIAISANFCLAACPPADLTGDCFVDFNDFAVMANQWLTTDPCVPGDMAYIPDGEFEMGEHHGDTYPSEYELPLHAVLLDSFFMSRFEITNQQYRDYLNSAHDAFDIKVDGGIVYASSDGNNSYLYCNTHSYDANSQIDYSGGVFSVRTKGGRDMSNDPMVLVSWYGAAACCNWRSQQEGKEQCYNLSTWACDFSKKGYRLPTEAEWEYAARGGLSGRRFPWGDTISHSQASYHSSSNCSYDISPTRGYHPTWNDGIKPYTSPVGSFSPNGYGLYDMAGNVWEWCNDWWDQAYYASSPGANPQGPVSGTRRVLRGGGWGNGAVNSRVACRHNTHPYNRFFRTGFRVVLDF
ncbi:MAG: formylglycine-generating enzyme family protein [Planctomycetes bacterium]|nr:formylglycine-generating enzyme family protein [Planctomycetota bacterium]